MEILGMLIGLVVAIVAIVMLTVMFVRMMIRTYQRGRLAQMRENRQRIQSWTGRDSD